MKKAVYIGKWRMPHKGHMWLFEQKLSQGIPLLIMVRDIPPTESDPLTPVEIKDIWETLYKEEVAKGMVEVMIIPDIESVNYGRGVGYEINEFKPSDDIKAISATQTKKMIQEANVAWHEFVDEKIWDKVHEYFSR